MKSRVMAGIVAGLLALGLAGCAGATPKPSPTPTPPFASADAAYKAAEATYRGYVDAVNKVKLDDPKTFEPVYAWLLDKALETERAELTAMAAKRWSLHGQSSIALDEPLATEDTDTAWGDVYLATCLDVRNVTVTDANGASVVSASRPDYRPVLIHFSRDGSTSTGMKIIRMQNRTGEPSCGK